MLGMPPLLLLQLLLSSTVRLACAAAWVGLLLGACGSSSSCYGGHIVRWQPALNKPPFVLHPYKQRQVLFGLCFLLLLGRRLAELLHP
jgi:hypothetical protein